METNTTNSVWGEPVAETTPETIPETIPETAPEIAPVNAEVPTPAEIATAAPDGTEVDISTIPENPAAENTPAVTEKIIEKIIEKHPEFANEDAKSLFDAFVKGDEDNIYEYLSQKRKDFTTMSDFDVVKAGLKKDNPTWTDKRVDLEFKIKYESEKKKDVEAIDADTDPEEYEKAVNFNKEIEKKEMLLEAHAEDYRIALEANKKTIQLPKIEQPQATQSTEPTPEQIAEINSKWEALVAVEVPKVSDLKLNVNGEEVIYKITDEEKTGLAGTMKNFNMVDYLTKRGWFDAEGNPNVIKITEDVYQLDNRDKIASSVATKSKNAATKAVVAEIKNVDLTRNGAVPPQGVDAGEVIWSY